MVESRRGRADLRGVPQRLIESSRREVQCRDSTRRMIERCLRRRVRGFTARDTVR